MKAEWTLYYVMVAAHLFGGGYTLVRGQTVHRLALLALAGGVALQLVGVEALAAAGVPIHNVSVHFDMILNVLMCSALLALALRFNTDNWILMVMVLQAACLALDAFVFQGDTSPTRAYFADAANLLNIAELATMAMATAAARMPKPLASPWYYEVATA